AERRASAILGCAGNIGLGGGCFKHRVASDENDRAGAMASTFLVGFVPIPDEAASEFYAGRAVSCRSVRPMDDACARIRSVLRGAYARERPSHRPLGRSVAQAEAHEVVEEAARRHRIVPF